MVCLRIENFVRDFFDDVYAILRALPFLLFYAFLYENFLEQIFWSS